MKLNLFKPSDFIKCNDSAPKLDNYQFNYDEYEVSRIANKILNDYIESLPLVYGHTKCLNFPNYWGPEENGQFDDTHTARVICIEPIKKKEPCTHEKIIIERGAKDFSEVFCQKCARKVMPIGWKVVGE